MFPVRTRSKPRPLGSARPGRRAKSSISEEFRPSPEVLRCSLHLLGEQPFQQIGNAEALRPQSKIFQIKSGAVDLYDAA
jgi:hypothetical protein